MIKHPDDDNFAHSTMSFGDHLEELRGALFRSVMGLMVGFLLGLGVASYVVDLIKYPLATALEDYYIKKSIKQVKLEHPDDPNLIDPAMERFIREHRLVFDRVYIEAAEAPRLATLLEEHQRSESSGQESAPAEATAAARSRGLPAAALHGTEDSPPAVKPQILGEPLPRPDSTLLATRTWRPIQSVVKALSAHEVFMIWMKAALVVGAIIASPYVFLQIWNFVAAGLYKHEKRYVYIYLPFSLTLFLAGAALAFFGVLGPVLGWLFNFNERMNIDPDPRISEWLGFVLFLPLGFGVSFQLPLVMLMLNRIGLLSIEVYLSRWRIAILIIFVVSMVLTPADPFSMLFMAIPLTFLYFGGIALCRYMPRGRNPFDAAYEP